MFLRISLPLKWRRRRRPIWRSPFGMTTTMTKATMEMLCKLWSFWEQCSKLFLIDDQPPNKLLIYWFFLEKAPFDIHPVFLFNSFSLFFFLSFGFCLSLSLSLSHPRSVPLSLINNLISLPFSLSFSQWSISRLHLRRFVGNRRRRHRRCRRCYRRHRHHPPPLLPSPSPKGASAAGQRIGLRDAPHRGKLWTDW